MNSPPGRRNGLASWLKRDLQLERLSLERVVSGTGLGHIAHWLLQMAEATPIHCSGGPEWRQGAEGDLPARSRPQQMVIH